MLGNLVIALREGLEASLVVGILIAYLVKLDRRDVLPKLWLGTGIAVLIPLGLGAILTFGPKTLTFQAQEVLGGGFSLIAVALTTTMIFWMSGHSRKLTAELRGEVDQALADGGSGWSVVLIAAIAVGREGIETALLVWANVRSSVQTSTPVTTAGLLIGFAIAFVLGYLVYKGAVHLNLGTFFSWTGLLLIFVAAGITAYAVGDLQEAGVLPGISHHAWELSHLLPAHDSIAYWPVLVLYTVLNAMFQVNLAPTVGQVIGWFVYVVPVLAIYLPRTFARKQLKSPPAPTSAPDSSAPDAHSVRP
jgi:high-affinity iron transporter